jgi:hypothetical protein
MKRFYPRFDNRLTASFEWIKDNTEKDDLFVALTPEDKELALLMQYRPVYPGYIGYLTHPGINCRPRFSNTTKIFRMNIYPDETYYIFCGPNERQYFPAFVPQFEAAFYDENVTIYNVR